MNSTVLVIGREVPTGLLTCDPQQSLGWNINPLGHSSAVLTCSSTDRPSSAASGSRTSSTSTPAASCCRSRSGARRSPDHEADDNPPPSFLPPPGGTAARPYLVMIAPRPIISHHHIKILMHSIIIPRPAVVPKKNSKTMPQISRPFFIIMPHPHNSISLPCLAPPNLTAQSLTGPYPAAPRS